jgi:hypothetical protein
MTVGGPQQPIGDNELCGIYYALVTQNDDASGPGGRIKVRFPWMPEGDRDQSHDAHLSVPMIGKEFGTYTVPEINDTVFVVFRAGDIRFPIVIGGMWNEVDEPPETNANGKNDFRLLKSRCGHRMILDDSDKTKVVVTDYKNTNSMTIGEYDEGGSGENTYAAQLPGGINSQPEKGLSVAALEGGARINIWCPSGTLKIEAKDVELTATLDAEVKANTVTVETKILKVGSVGMSNYEGKPIKLGP